MADWKSLLITGPEPALMDWQYAAMGFAELFDRRGQTVRVRIHGIDYTDLANPGWGEPKDPAAVAQQLERVIELAKAHDVTVQELTREGVAAETYPVLHLGTHGMKWPR